MSGSFFLHYLIFLCGLIVLFKFFENLLQNQARQFSFWHIHRHLIGTEHMLNNVFHLNITLT